MEDSELHPNAGMDRFTSQSESEYYKALYYKVKLARDNSRDVRIGAGNQTVAQLIAPASDLEARIDSSRAKIYEVARKAHVDPAANVLLQSIQAQVGSTDLNQIAIALAKVSYNQSQKQRVQALSAALVSPGGGDVVETLSAALQPRLVNADNTVSARKGTEDRGTNPWAF